MFIASMNPKQKFCVQLLSKQKFYVCKSQVENISATQMWPVVADYKIHNVHYL